MNSKTRVILLSVFAVLFACVSAFAFTGDDFSVEEDSEYASASFYEAYNYKTRIYAYTEYGEDGYPIPLAASWDITSADWFTWWVSNDNSVIIEGVLPDYSSSEAEGANDYVIHAIAHVSGDVDTGAYDEETGDSIYVSGDISADVGYGEGITVTVEEDTTRVSTFSPEMISIDFDASKVESIDTVGTEYSVLLTFKTSTDIVPVYQRDSEGNIQYDEETGDPITTGEFKDGSTYVILQLDASDLESLAEYINLPQWLSYEVVSSQDSVTYDVDADSYENDGNTYVKELRIFYKSSREPVDGAKGSVRITGAQLDSTYTDYHDPEYTGLYDYDPTVGWGKLAFSAIPPITLDKTQATLQVIYGSSADLTVNYTKQNPSGDITFSPKLDGKVNLTASWTPTNPNNSTEPAGVITVNAEPVASIDAVYSTDMVVMDTNGRTASMRLYVSVDVPVIHLSDYSANLSAAFGSTASKVITYDTVEYSADVISPAVSSDFNFSLEVSTDAKTITLSIAPKLSADYIGTLTIYDVYGKSADIALTLHSFMSGDPEVKVSGDQAVRIITTGTTGGAGTVTLNAGNAFGNVLWEVLNIPSGFTFTPLMYTGNPATFTISTDASVTTKTAYSADVRATDGYGRITTFNLTWTVEPPALVLSGDFSPNPLNVYAGNTADTELAFLYAEPKSGDFWFMSPDISADVSFDVSWTLANKDSADTTASADSIIKEGKFTVRAEPLHVESKDYTTTFYFTDSNDNVVSAELTVSVTIPVITLSSDNPVVHMSKPPFVTDWPDWHTEWYYAKPVSIDLSVIPSGLSFDCVSSDETDTVKHGRFVFAYMPMTTTGWSGTVKVYDEYGGSADIKISLDVELSSEPMKTTVTVSGDSSSSPTITAGESRTITLTADNAYGKVRWGVSNMAALQALGITLNKVSETKTTAVYTIGTPLTLPAGTYTANITATDSVDRTAAVYNLTITAKAAPIVLSGDFASIDVVYPASGEATVDYYYSPFTSWSMSPDISADISLDVIGIPAESTTVQGKITVTAAPLTASADKYTTTLTFTDENGNTASKDITINVTLPDFAVTASAASLTLIEGNSADVTITASGNAGLVTWTLGDIPDGITVESSDTLNATQYDTVRSYVVTAVSADNYSFDVTAKDAAGRTASVTINVAVTASGDFAVVPEFNSLAVDVNTPRNISFSAVNNSGLVTWSLGDVPLGISVDVVADLSYATANNTMIVYTVRGLVPGASGTITATATDAAGNTASATVTITVSGAPVTFSITPSAPSVTVNAGATQNVSLTATGNSGTVTWTLGTVSPGLTVTPATQTGTTASYTVTGTTAGTYSVTVTATDAAGHSATATISITVSTVTLTITPSAHSVKVNRGSSQGVSFTASGNSGNVTWKLGTVPAGITVTPATQTGTTARYTVAGETAGASGTVTVTATDAAGNSATATINVTVSHPTPTPIPISTPRIDITDTTVRSNIVQSLAAKLGSRITSSTEVATLPSSATSGNISYVGNNTVYIPTIVVETAKIYVFGVSVDNLVAGSTMTWTPHVSSSSTGEYLTASEEEENATFLDDSNNIVTKVPANKHINVAAYFEPGKIYEPSITTSTPSTSGDIIGITSSSGGCSAGLGALVSALAAAFFISKKRS